MLIFLLWISLYDLWAVPASGAFFLSDALPTTHRTDTLSISTGPFTCTAIVPVSKVALEEQFSWQAEDCGGLQQSVALEFFSTATNTWEFPPGAKRDGELYLDVPQGLNRLLVQSTDACGQTARDTLYFSVVDQVAPRVSCRNNLSLSLASGGTTSLSATDFVAEADDNCSAVDILIRRSVPDDCLERFLALGFDLDTDGSLTTADGFTLLDGVLYTPWMESVPFFCCDAGFSQVVALRATDQAGNTSTCSQTVRITDGQVLACQAPPGIRLGCNDSRLGDLSQLGTATPRQNDCGTISIQELPVVEDLDDCGAGTIIRSFQAVKYAGTAQEERSAICRQTVQVIQDHHYSICFPADTTVSCVQDDDLPGVSLLSDGCELFAVTENTERFFPQGTDSGCYQLRRTFQVINWCEYNGSTAPVVIGRDWDAWNGTNPGAPLGNGQEGDQPVCITVARFLNDVFPDTVWYDIDMDPYNATPEFASVAAQDGYFWRVISGNANPESPVYYNGNGTTWGNNPQDTAAQATGFGSNGFWQYTQIVTVDDPTVPVLSVMSPQDTFLAVSGSDCSAEVSIVLQLADACLLNWDDYTFTARLDLHADGSYEESPYLDLALFPDILVSGRYPLGTHQLEVKATDLCGNETLLQHTFVVLDRRAPRPVCINGLTVELEPTAPGDSIGPAGVPIFVDNFIASSITDCSGEVHYSINLLGEGFTPEQDGLVLTCADLGTVVVEIYAWDDAGNMGSCETYVLVQDREEPVCHADNLGYVSGLVTTPDLVPLPDAAIQLSGPFERVRFSDETGGYNFSNLQSGYTYQLTPEYDRDYINGVSTYDIYLIQQHILGVEPFTSPYQYIAADANRSGTVSVSDMVQIRKLVLSVDVTLAENTSWRFVDGRHVFGAPQEALTEGFPEQVRLPELPADSLIVDFTAVKVGDVSGNALTDEVDVRSFYTQGILELDVSDRRLEPGVMHAIPLRMPASSALQSLQFALQVRPEAATLRRVEGHLLTDKQMAIFAEAQTITASWVAPPRTGHLSDTTLLTLMLEVEEPVQLSDILSLSSRFTPAEAMINGEVFLPELQFTAPDLPPESLHARIFPNPAIPDQDITIQFQLPGQGRGELQVIDSQGKVLAQKEAYFQAGRQQWTLPSTVFSASGWYSLRLTAANNTVTLPLLFGNP